MKINKKLIVATLSTALGLGIVGSITGTVAWYQYSTKGMVSLIGNHVSESGILQITTTPADASSWKKDLVTADVTGTFDASKFVPVTFGEVAKDAALPAQAYLNPLYGVKEMNQWKQATANTHYLQYDIYLRAQQYDNHGDLVNVEKDIYISDMVLNDVSGSKPIAKAVRVHIAVDGGDNFLIAKDETSVITHGKLDLDNNGTNDPEIGYQWDDTLAAEVDYGLNEAVGATNELESYTLAQIVNERDTEGFITDDADKLICTTTGAGEDPVKLTITVWVEGWQKLGSPTPSAIWDYAKQGEAGFNLGITFDVGRGAYR